MTGIPIYNVNNNCSTGSTALYLGKQIIESQNAQCVLVLGFEKMESGSLSAKVKHHKYLCLMLYCVDKYSLYYSF